MPQFSPSEVKIAVAPITVKPAGLACSAELYLGAKVATSGVKSFNSTGIKQDISLPITMPAPGTYPVYLDVTAQGMLIGAYKAIEDVVIAIPAYSLEQTAIETYPEEGAILPITLVSGSLIYVGEQVKLWQYLQNISGTALPPWSIAMSVTHPDGTKHELGEVRRFISGDPEQTWAYIVFSPFSVTQTGVYTVEATLIVEEQVIDELSLSLVASVASGWNNPISYNDPDNAWSNEEAAMLGQPVTGYIGGASSKYSYYLSHPIEFGFPTIISDRLRISSMECPMDQTGCRVSPADVLIDVYYDNAWHNVHSGNLYIIGDDELEGRWGEVVFPQHLVSGIRITWDKLPYYDPEGPYQWAFLFAVQLFNIGG
ncbi:MAG TPA: hypothetical protein VMV84_03725 [Dehalococcoidales bacterium]|nr:hypothetical protein [Dehalococcoidales bacterium]